jgi:hypothetical protein
MFKFIFWFTVAYFYTLLLFASEKPILIKGDTNYSESESKSLNTSIEVSKKIKLFEPYHKRYAFFIDNRIVTDYDHFFNEINFNVFTHLSFEF